jgi:hypothetical protein
MRYTDLSPEFWAIVALAALVLLIGLAQSVQRETTNRLLREVGGKLDAVFGGLAAAERHFRSAPAPQSRSPE